MGKDKDTSLSRSELPRKVGVASLIALAATVVSTIYLNDFFHRYDDKFCEELTAEELKGKSAAEQRALRKIEKSFYRRREGWKFLEGEELALIDDRFARRGFRNPAPEIVIVAIDNHSFEQASQFGLTWPWPRSVYATVIDRLVSAGAKVIGIDVLFDEEQTKQEDKGTDNDTDATLAKAIRRAGNVVLAADFAEVEENNSIQAMPRFPIEPLEDAACTIGLTRLPKDSDGRVRAMPLFVRHKESGGMGYYPSVPVQAVSLYQGIPLKRTLEEIKLGVFRGAPVPVTRSRFVPGMDLQSFYTLINFAGPAATVKTVPLYQILDPELFAIHSNKGWYKNKIVLVGATAEVLHDVFLVPFRDRGAMPGVEVLANAIHTLLQRSYYSMASFEASFFAILILALVTAVVTALIGRPISSAATAVDRWLAFSLGDFRIGFYGTTWLILYLGFGLLPVVYGYYRFSTYLFVHRRLWLPVVYPVLAAAISYVGVVAYMFLTEEREKKKMHGRMSRFVAPTVLAEILTHKEEVPPAKRTLATLLFTDLQGFTTLSENNEPELVVRVLNEYMERMCAVIFKHEGTIDKFIGDAIMVIFGAPKYFDDHPRRAILSAIEMQEECAKFREYGRSQGWPDFFMRIGVHTGDAIVGSVGSRLRVDYTAIGDTVNLAARLEGLNKEHKSWIMCSEATYDYVKDLIVAEYVPAAKVKGKTQEVNVYKVYGLLETGRRDDFWGDGKPKEAGGNH